MPYSTQIVCDEIRITLKVITDSQCFEIVKVQCTISIPLILLRNSFSLLESCLDEEEMFNRKKAARNSTIGDVRFLDDDDEYKNRC